MKLLLEVTTIELTQSECPIRFLTIQNLEKSQTITLLSKLPDTMYLSSEQRNKELIYPV